MQVLAPRIRRVAQQCFVVRIEGVAFTQSSSRVHGRWNIDRGQSRTTSFTRLGETRSFLQEFAGGTVDCGTWHCSWLGNTVVHIFNETESGPRNSGDAKSLSRHVVYKKAAKSMTRGQQKKPTWHDASKCARAKTSRTATQIASSGRGAHALDGWQTVADNQPSSDTTLSLSLSFYHHISGVKHTLSKYIKRRLRPTRFRDPVTARAFVVRARVCGEHTLIDTETRERTQTDTDRH